MATAENKGYYTANILTVCKLPMCTVLYLTHQGMRCLELASNHCTTHIKGSSSSVQKKFGLGQAFKRHIGMAQGFYSDLAHFLERKKEETASTCSFCLLQKQGVHMHTNE